jgi:hypothetical protein
VCCVVWCGTLLDAVTAQTFELDVDLADDPIFCPPLNVRVYDDRAIGKPLLGYVS